MQASNFVPHPGRFEVYYYGKNLHRTGSINCLILLRNKTQHVPPNPVFD
jgi:hypothetical protein